MKDLKTGLTICEICGEKTLVSYSVTVREHAEKELCSECQIKIEIEEYEKEKR